MCILISVAWGLVPVVPAMRICGLRTNGHKALGYANAHRFEQQSRCLYSS